MRFFEICGIEQREEIETHEVIFIGVYYVIIYAIYALNIPIAAIIEIEGALINFLLVWVMPMIIHIRCVYFNKHHP